MFRTRSSSYAGSTHMDFLRGGHTHTQACCEQKKSQETTLASTPSLKTAKVKASLLPIALSVHIHTYGTYNNLLV